MNTISDFLKAGAFLAGSLVLSLTSNAQVNRSIDGSNNNLTNSDWGAVGQTFVRWADACYADSISMPIGANRTSPRIISNELFDQGSPLVDAMGLSDYCWVFGQFVDHDVTLALDGNEFIYIPVPRGDIFDPFNTGAALIPMRRSAPAPGTGTSITNPRQHFNEITAFIDGSNVYGSTEAHAAWLRTFSAGKLKTSPGNLLPYNTIDGTFDADIDPTAPHMDNPLPFHDKIYVAGDPRVNENPLLIAMHTLFMREHNRLCDVLASRNPGLSDEELYQRARKLNGAILQSIIYNEWLPAMGVELDSYTGYDASVNPGISNTFAAAAFRMGHTLLNGQLRRLNPDGSVHPLGHLSLSDAFFDPTSIEISGGIDPFIKGMAEQTQQPFDARIIDGIRNFLFGQPGRGGLDLASININRGRERGIPDYNSIRESLGLNKISTWSEVVSDTSVIAKLESLYTSPDDTDIWVGMLAEDHVPGKLFGPLVLEAFKRQFSALRDGDRYFYLADPALDLDDCAIVTNTRMSDVIRRNTDVDIMQGNVFTSMLHSEVPVCNATVSEADITVSVALASGLELPDVSIRVYGLDDDMPIATTNADGIALLENIPTCDDYRVEAEKLGLPGQSVTSFDLFLMGQHILGVSPLTNPYQLIAADVNRSGSVSGFDITNARRVILGLENDFMGQPAWRFLDTSRGPASGIDPLQYDWNEEIDLTLFSQSNSSSLLAVKIGDVNQSYSLTAPLQPRSSAPFSVSKNLDKADFVDFLPLMEGIVAYELEVEMPENIEVEAVLGLNPDEYAIDNSNSRVRIATFNTLGSVSGFSLKLKGSIQNLTSEDFHITPSKSIAYQADGARNSIKFISSGNSLALASNFYPNPFQTSTVLFMPELTLDGEIELIVFDAIGKEVARKKVVGERLELSKNELLKPVSGQLSWVIEKQGIQLLSGMLQYFD